MKMTKKQLEKIIVEELEKQLEEGLWDKIKSGLGNPFKKSQSGQNLSSNVPPPLPSDEEQEVTDDQIQSANDDKKDPMDDVDVDTSEFDQPSQKSNPQAAKAKDIFVQNAREFFNSHVRGKMRQQIMSMITSNPSADAERMARAEKKRKKKIELDAARELATANPPALAEQVTANSPRGQAFIIANSIMNEVEKFLSSITPEEFAKVFADVAQSKLKDDPKALKQALKSFRMVENDQKAARDKSDEEAAREKFIAQNRKRAQAIDQISGERDIAGSSVSKTFSQQLLNLMKLKGLDAAKLVKNAITSTPAEKMGMSQQQKNMVMGKMIATLSKSLSDYFLGKKDNLKFAPSPVVFGDDEKEVPKPKPKPATEPATEPEAEPDQQKPELGDDEKEKNKQQLRSTKDGTSPFARGYEGAGKLRENEMKRFQKLAGILKD